MTEMELDHRMHIRSTLLLTGLSIGKLRWGDFGHRYASRQEPQGQRSDLAVGERVKQFNQVNVGLGRTEVDSATGYFKLLDPWQLLDDSSGAIAADETLQHFARFFVDLPAGQFDAKTIRSQPTSHDAGRLDTLVSEPFAQTPHVDQLSGSQVHVRARILQAGMRTHGAQTRNLSERFVKMLDAPFLIAKVTQPQLQGSVNPYDTRRRFGDQLLCT